ncbi:MAG: universal stress protein [Pirellulaceae bacterium]|jgi:nucleotide-binding universal stress UspA family protein|nr:universal stress protein [Pirellulaceae bacterium]HJN10820.1 universal stress protein [Pirellulaceae bacterium]
MWSPRQRILVPIDFSEQSRTALSVALEIAGSNGQDPKGRAVGDLIAVIHVLPDLSPAEPGKLWNTVSPAPRIEHATTALKDWLKQGDQELDAVEVCIGDPATEICRAASERGADLIVLPSHGRTGMKRLLIGSVAERVVRLAPCPVLVLRHFQMPAQEPDNS